VGRQGIAVYPWISESFEIIQPMLPCSKNEAIARLVEMMPQRAVDAALLYRSSSRFCAAKQAIRHLRNVRITIDGDMVYEKKARKQSMGRQFLKRLQQAGTVDESEVQFTVSSMQSYRLSLKTLGWIEVSGTLWKWIGPDDADWSAVTKENQRKKNRDR